MRLGGKGGHKRERLSAAGLEGEGVLVSNNAWICQLGGAFEERRRRRVDRPIAEVSFPVIPSPPTLLYSTRPRRLSLYR